MSSDDEHDDFGANPELPKCIEERFHEAVFRGDMKTVRSCLDDGVDVNWRDHMGWAALHLACRQKETEIAQLLITKGADIHLRGPNGWTALHYASHADDTVIVKQLIDLGADKLAVTLDQRTPRDFAIKWAMKKLFYSRPEYEVEYERWLYPEQYDAEMKAKEEEDRKKWEEIKARMDSQRELAAK